jgi:hypothetical protein
MNNPDGSKRTGDRRFRAMFGCLPGHCAILWNTINDEHPIGGEPKHLLYALMFLKVYGTEHVHSSIAKCDEKTFRKWAWAYVELLSNMDIVSEYIHDVYHY